MITVLRYDRGTLRSPKRMPNGTLRVDAALTRTGVLIYRNPDGTERREYRPPEEVFNRDSLESAEGAPITDDHPPEMINSKNAMHYARGALMGAPIRDEKLAVGSMIVHEDSLIRKMESGKSEISPGYLVDLEEKSGVSPDGERYDFVQRNIRYNHFAVVQRGRSGPTVRARMDSVDLLEEVSTSDILAAARAILDACPSAREDGDDLNVQGHSAPGREAEATERNIMSDKKKDTGDNPDAIMAAAQALAAEKQRADGLSEQLTTEKARADKAEGDADTLRAELATIKATRTDEAEVKQLRDAVVELTTKIKKSEQARMDAESPDKLRVAVKRRVAIETAAREILAADVRLDDLDDRTIMVNVVEKLHGVKIAADKPDQYVIGRFDTAIEGFRECADALRSINKKSDEIQQQRVDTREERTKAHRAQWQSPLSNDIRGRKEA